MEEDLRRLYPFKSHFCFLENGERIHYIDCGEGFPVVMVHGIPTWSFMYRNLISDLSSNCRCIAPDNLGCGLSSKPQKWPYRLQGHIDNLDYLLEHELQLKQFDLVVHDWGGAIGMGVAIRHPERIRRIVLMNTAAFLSKEVPWAIHLVRTPWLGALLVRGCNALVRTACRRAVARPMPSNVTAAYTFPYSNWHDRIATQRFAQDIPLNSRHPSYATFLNLQENLHLLADKKILICWGEKDFCFTMKLFERWKNIYPRAKAISFPDAAHYLLEDAPKKILPVIEEFLTCRA